MNEILTLCFYITLSCSLFSNSLYLTKIQVASDCIKIVIIALALNILISTTQFIINSYGKIKKICRKKKNKIAGVEPNEDSLRITKEDQRIITS